MDEDFFPSIRQFCYYWESEEMLQQTYLALKSDASDENDAVIDSAKSMVECACKVIIEKLDDRENQLLVTTRFKPEGLLAEAVKLLKLGYMRDTEFQKVVASYKDLTVSLKNYRNAAGIVSHGKNGFLKALGRHHQRGAIAAADAIIGYLHEAYLYQYEGRIEAHSKYENFKPQNELIDSHASFAANVDNEFGGVALKIFIQNEELPFSVSLSKMLFLLDKELYNRILEVAQQANKMQDDDG